MTANIITDYKLTGQFLRPPSESCSLSFVISTHFFQPAQRYASWGLFNQCREACPAKPSAFSAWNKYISKYPFEILAISTEKGELLADTDI